MSIAGGKNLQLTGKRLELLQALRRERGLAPSRSERIPRQPERDSYPLSFNQQRLWLLDQLQPQSAVYVLHQAFQLRGRLSPPALAASLAEVVRRHGSLRTTFAASGGEPVQRVARALPLPLPLLDGSALPPGARRGWLGELAAAVARRPFDLARGPLLRALLLKLSGEEHVLLLGIHHIATDGWSMGVLLREVAALYGAFAAGLPSPLPELPIQYVDFACWQRAWLTEELLARQLGYWKETLAGAPLLQLPTDRPRPAFETFRGFSTIFMLDEAASARLREFAQRRGVTLFMTLLGAFAALLCRYSGQPEASIGSPAANRNRVQLEPLIGFFVNTLVMRIDAASDPDFGELLGRVQRTVVGAFSHQDLPFERLVAELQPARDLSRSPLFQVMFTLQSAQQSGYAAPLALPGLAIEPIASGAAIARFDLTLAMTESPEGIGGVLEYNVDLFDRATIERLAVHLETLLAGAVADPARRLSELPLLSAAERHQLEVEWLDTERPAALSGAPHPELDVSHLRASGPALARGSLGPAAAPLRGGGGGILPWIERRVAERPDAVALRFGGIEVSYRALLSEAERMARRLRGLGLLPGETVGVAVERSARLVGALLGIWKAGGAYVPMDPSYPEPRLLHMLEDAGCRVALVDDATPDALAKRVPVAVRLAAISDPPPAADAEAEEHAAAGDDTLAAEGALAYVLFTSGSTGRPKGVAVPHRALQNFLLAMAERPGLGASDVLLAVTSLSFDIAALELFLPLLVGGRIELLSREESGDVARLLGRLRACGATAMQATPATWRMLIEAGWQGEPGIKVLCGGEALPERLAAELCARSRSVWNLYGPTETTVWSAVSRVAPGSAVGIGPPIANTTLYVVGRGGEAVPVGVPGELCIGGAGVALGYRGRPELTAERFVPDRFARRAGSSRSPGGRLYRTGDLVRWRPRGGLEFLGRIDHQIKVRGFRIEPGEVEAALEAHPRVARAVVVALAAQDQPGAAHAARHEPSAAHAARYEISERLVAYLVAAPEGGEAVPAGELHALAAAKLPAYMVPSAFVWLAALPLTPNGKVDRRALPAPEAARPERAASYLPPCGALEELIAGIWSQLLKVGKVGRDDNFFAIGGHSLLGMQAVSRLGELLASEVPLRHLFEAPTVAGLADRLRRDAGAGDDLEAAARLVLDLVHLSAEQVEGLLAEQEATLPLALATADPDLQPGPMGEAS